MDATMEDVLRALRTEQVCAVDIGDLSDSIQKGAVGILQREISRPQKLNLVGITVFYCI